MLRLSVTTELGRGHTVHTGHVSLHSAGPVHTEMVHVRPVPGPITFPLRGKGAGSEAKKHKTD